MSIEIEDQYGGIHLESQKKGMISYTRDFLLSLSGLDLCKKLPSGLDQSILSEIEDAPQDRYRIPGSLSSQNFRRNEYSSSPPTRGDSSTYSRNTPGKWDSRSSNKIDTDSQPDLDSESGMRGSSQPRRPWQVPEHDGLLGSGSFPRPSGYAAGSSAPKFQANAQSQLSRSNEPYQPPRPYKAPTQSRREFTDSLNDETFGSSELTNDDRSEEERKRRASFESMRKEQHKTFQEGVREEFDITSLRDDPKDDKIVIKRNNAPDVLMRQPVSNHDSAKPSLPSLISVSRPLVPPGFSSSMTEKDPGSKTLNNLHKPEVGNELERSLLHAKGNLNLKATSDKQEEKQFLEQLSQRGSLTENVPGNNKSEKIRSLLSASDVSSKVIDGESQLYKTSKLSAGFELGENRKTVGRDTEEVKVIKVLGESSPAPSTSILEKLFGNTITLNDGGSSHLIEQHDSSADDMWNPHTVQSSKFAQWFSEDEKKPSDDLSASRPNDLLSLFAGGEKVRSQVFDVKANEQALLSSSQKGSELMSSLIPDNIQNNELLGNSGKPEAVPAVLTCEDLEQSILSEITENCSNLPPLPRSRSDHEGNTEKQRENIDGRASQHLLSLLQKGTALEDATESSGLGISSSGKVGTFEPAANLGRTLLNSKETDAGNVPSSAKPLTLETLFGSAFMKELQGAPSDHRGSVAYGSDSLGPPFNSVNASTSEIGSSIPSHGNGLVASNQRQQMKPDITEEQHLFGFDPRTGTELRSKSGGFDGSVDIRLPEEDSLLSVGGDSSNLLNFMPGRNFAKEELLSNPGRPLDIPGKLSGLNHAFREERPILGQEGPTFSRGSYNMRDPDVHFNLHAQSSSPQLHPPQLNQGMFHPLDPHPGNINAQMKFMNPENIIHRDSPPNHHFPANMLRPPFHHPSAAPTGFDRIAHNPLLQPMHAPGNFPRQQHLLRGLPRGAPFSQHPNSQVSGFMQEPNSVQGFPFGQRQPSYGGTRIPPQAPDAAGGVNNHPGELQRLMEMELRSNSKQVHPFPAGGHGPGMYGHELDMGFGFR